jgi:hypothetical protein
MPRTTSTQEVIGSAAIGIDVLRWQFWASYKLPYAIGIKAPDCPYTLKKHLDAPN